jgi:hypothetical protein
VKLVEFGIWSGGILESGGLIKHEKLIYLGKSITGPINEGCLVYLSRYIQKIKDRQEMFIMFDGKLNNWMPVDGSMLYKDGTKYVGPFK